MPMCIETNSRNNGIAKLATLQHDDDVLSIAWSPCDTKLATCTRDEALIIWDLEGYRKLSTFETKEARGVHSK